MEAVQRDHWYFVVLMFLPFLKVSVQQKEAVTVRLEEGMVLECLCPWDGKFIMVSWTKEPNKASIAVFHNEYEPTFSHRYRERIEFLRTTPMDGSISVRNVTHQDIGLYHCSVETFPQGSWKRDVQVEDLDEPPEEEEDSSDSMAPEVNEVHTELSAEQGNNLTISCNHEHRGTVSKVILEWMAQGPSWDNIGVCEKVGRGVVVKDFSDRVRVSCTNSLVVSLHLTGVQQQDSGFYRCIFTTDSGVQITTVLLTVPLPGGFSLSVYMMCIYIGAGAAGLILLIVTVILSVKYRKRRKCEEYRVKVRLSQRPSHNFYENICPRKKTRQIRNCPVYINLQTARTYKTRPLHNK